MHLIPLKSLRIKSGDNLITSVQESLLAENETLQSRDILVITSKVVAYSQGLLQQIQSREDFRDLVKKEADQVLEEGDMVLTIKNKVLIPNAGIDNSNTPEGMVILWPKDPFGAARDIRRVLMDKFHLSDLGIVISDSHCQPLRMGTTGIAIGWAGFEGVEDVIGSSDLFGRKMKYTKIAAADNLASAANLEMGETDASIPYVLVRNANVVFSDKDFSEEDYFIRPEDCIYRGLYNQNLTSYDPL